MSILKKIFLPYYSLYIRFSKAKLQTNYIDFLKYKLGINKRYWPAHKNCLIANYNNIYVGINSLVGRPGNYIQGAGKIFIGDYVQLAPNVGILSTNHDLYDQRNYNSAEVIIGDYCWIGMNSQILAGVTLGTRTIVAAGSVVTKSFPEGFCVVGGSPAKIIKQLDPAKFEPWKDEEEFYGFIPKEEFEKTKLYKEGRIKFDK
ncbi:acyltransferase [Faecalibacter macacae]|uniref:Acyltransferase n=1 Tax=Faecalibacter macacae TaxID=1859289 RepID=A0A3L9MCU3_9FLAO|nr:acyltransferase [Faecalibacter macacae]RLZ10552.1 acyltransferase [Faecalibacter macacae]